MTEVNATPVGLLVPNKRKRGLSAEDSKRGLSPQETRGPTILMMCCFTFRCQVHGRGKGFAATLFYRPFAKLHVSFGMYCNTKKCRETGATYLVK